jgi:hypothetical protein
VSNVKVANELGFCFGVLDDLWQWRAWHGALVDDSKEWVRNGEKRKIV